MLRIQLPDGSTADAVIIVTGPNAGRLRLLLSDHPDVIGDVIGDLVNGLPVTGGDPADLLKAAAIIRAKGFWLAAEPAMRARRDADRLDTLAKGPRP